MVRCVLVVHIYSLHVINSQCLFKNWFVVCHVRCVCVLWRFEHVTLLRFEIGKLSLFGGWCSSLIIDLCCSCGWIQGESIDYIFAISLIFTHFAYASYALNVCVFVWPKPNPKPLVQPILPHSFLFTLIPSLILYHTFTDQFTLVYSLFRFFFVP